MPHDAVARSGLTPVKTMRHPIGNFVLFQICWLANCAGAASGWPQLGPLFTAAWIALHLRAMAEDRSSEVWMLLAAAAFGYAADSLLVLLGLIEFPPEARLGAPSTLWMVALWVGFAATLRHSLRWLAGRYLLGALLGAAGGPLAYRAGEALGAIRIPDSFSGLAAVSVEWAIAMPALLAFVTLVGSRTAVAAGRSNETERSC
jgi:hypothetical protein